MPGAFPNDIFISYSQKDRAAAEKLQAAFAAHKLKVWRDERLLDNPERDFIGTINEALERSAKVVVLWSRNSVGSAWVLAEAEKARMAQKVAPLALEPLGALLPYIPTPFNILPTIDVSAETIDLAPILRALGAEQVAGQPEGVLSLVKADVDISKLPDTFAKKLYGRDREMAKLVAAWDGGATRIFAFDAMGGAGKTALVYHFVQALKASGWRGAGSVFAWSFYSQGSNEDRQTSADDFFKAAFKHFGGDKAEPARDPREKGVELAHLVQRHRALLILDGMEPLQYAAGRTGGGKTSAGVVGGVKDPGVKALLSLLADNNPGLCLVTTRIQLAELRGNPSVVFEPLDRLPLMAGIELLRDLGVEPATPPAAFALPRREEFAALHPPYAPPADYAPPPAAALPAIPARVAKDFIGAVEELKGHALALTLIGKSLAEDHRGDIRAVHELPRLPDIHPEDPTRDPYRVMRSIEIALARRIEEQGQTKNPAAGAPGRQLALLFFLGLFDRPADTALLPVVFPLAAADYLQPDPADLRLAAKDLLELKARLEDLTDEREKAARELRKQQIEHEREKVGAERDAIIEAARRAMARRAFAGMAELTRDRSKIVEALRELARRGLIAKFDESAPFEKAAIDCHPLVREYFGARLKELDRESFKAMHGRLYDHYRYAGLPSAFCNPITYALLADQCAYPNYGARKTIDDLISGRMNEQTKANTPKPLVNATSEQLRKAAALLDGAEWETALKRFLPDDEAGMTPLFAAIAHGCLAEREEETFNEVYIPRIERGSEGFVTHKLGLYGQELAAQASFFEAPFIAPSSRLSPDRRALVLSHVGFGLRALGRLVDATVPMRAAVQARDQAMNWGSAARDAGNLSELLLTIGLLSGEDGAVAVGEKAATFADRSRDGDTRVLVSTTHADALAQAGSLARAEALFRQAEALQKNNQPHLPRLYSLRGYQCCDLILARGRAAEAASRYRYLVGARSPGDPILDFALEELINARAAIVAIPPSAPAPKHCAARSAEALAALRRANQEVYVVPGLLAHAEALWRCGDAKAANEPLREAEAIAARGPMPLFMTDAHLLHARIALSQGDFAAARRKRDAALDLVAKHGYGRAAPELALLTAEIARAENSANGKAAIDAAAKAIRGKPYRDERTGIAIDGGWWGLLPRLELLLPANDARLAELRAARDAYNAERDAYLAAEEADHQAKLAKEWAEEDRALADPAFRRQLSDILVASGHPPLDELPLREQRNVARQMREARQQDDAPDLPQIPDALVRQIFADSQAQELLRDVMRQNNLPGAPADLPLEIQRAIVAALVKAGAISLGETAQAGAPPPREKKKRGWWPF